MPERAIQVAGQPLWPLFSELSRSRVGKKAGYPGRGFPKPHRWSVETYREQADPHPEISTRQAIQVAGRFAKSLSRLQKTGMFRDLSFYPYL